MPCAAGWSKRSDSTQQAGSENDRESDERGGRCKDGGDGDGGFPPAFGEADPRDDAGDEEPERIGADPEHEELGFPLFGRSRGVEGHHGQSGHEQPGNERRELKKVKDNESDQRRATAGSRKRRRDVVVHVTG